MTGSDLHRTATGSAATQAARHLALEAERNRLRVAMERIAEVYEDVDNYADHLAALDAIATICDEALDE